MDHAIARLDWDRWLADCPNRECTNAMALAIGQGEFLCRYPVDDRGNFGGCMTNVPIDWPDDPAAIQASLAGLPEPERRWAPEPEPEPELQLIPFDPDDPSKGE